MTKRRAKALAVMVIVFAVMLSACRLGAREATEAPQEGAVTEGAPKELPQEVMTEAAATIHVQVTEMAARAIETQAQLTAEAPPGAVPTKGQATSTSEAQPAPTETPAPPTEAPAPTATPQPTATSTPLPTATPTIKPTVAIPQVRAEISTNCRQGPGKDYKVVGYLMLGHRANVYGRDFTGHWWYVLNPNTAGRFCWVSDTSTTIEGDGNVVPVVLNPTPRADALFSTSGFIVDSVDIIACPGGSTMIFSVYNAGSKILESMSLQIENLTTSTLLLSPSASNAPFRSSSRECSAGIDHLLPGNTLYVGATMGEAPSPGQEVQATIKLCTEDNLGGSCYQNYVEFIAP